ncbi:MAG TPA: hypothetical protein PLM53_17025 [Spirochaetota bacterium]|nr:hypothetical protein [Spirochaetota bacterium]HPC43158.1 hypothetical protein [Spirochaetota bacterium]HPL19169.1 hypothetical protein [Spirochaetota bacterium]HQF10062.1 hypothetical protein [Spirochaetota bacterium]HQH98802.1 hypothetical protein [Spirochaetota bacterium]
MKRTLVAILGILAVSCAVTAKEDPRVEHIRRLYQDALRMEAADAPMPVHEVKFESNLAAIGNQTTRVTFVYTSWQADPERDPYLMGHRLLKVNVRYNIAAMSGFLVEYLYDEKERPVFYYAREETETYKGRDSKIVNERRYYFDNGSLIMAMVNSTDDDGKKEKYSATGPFNKKDTTQGRIACQNAERYLKFFRHMVEIERLK